MPIRSNIMNNREGEVRHRGHTQSSTPRNRSRSISPDIRTSRDNVRVFRFWKWEILNFALAVGLLSAIYGILERYDNQRVPDWGSAINLSTLTAIIATLFRMCLFFVVAEIIGQAKWAYFISDGLTRNDGPVRRLIETSHFDMASRGLIGSIKLLPNIVRDTSTLLAVLVMAVSLGTGPFVQQAIRTYACQFPLDGVHSSLNILRTINSTNSSAWNIISSPKFHTALIYSLFQDNDAENAAPMTADCPTGNCTFLNHINNTYSSVAVCSSCVDTTSLISSADWTLREWTPGIAPEGPTLHTYAMRNQTLPNGMVISIPLNASIVSGKLSVDSAQVDLDWASSLLTPEMMALSVWSLCNTTIFTSTGHRGTDSFPEFIAVTCILYSCLRSYRGSVINGVLHESLVSTVPLVPNLNHAFPPNFTNEDIHNMSYQDLRLKISTPPESIQTHFQAVQSPCMIDNTVYTIANMSSAVDSQRLLLLHADPIGTPDFTIENVTAPQDCIYNMDRAILTDLSLVMQYLFLSGNCSVSPSGSGKSFFCDNNQFWLAAFYNDNSTTINSTIKQVETFTDRLSNKLRMGVISAPSEVLGQVLHTTVCTTVDYRWLLFPTLLITIVGGLLLWSLLKSWRCRGRELLWKSSILPFLLYGDRFVVQNGEDVSVYSPDSPFMEEEKPLDLDQMESEAKQRKVRFRGFNH
ncbi:hypothetical protein F5B19DRAFT_412700 [Rostrohypoxylon terebratum]|nr:hypothetical protein F5B19DRAFT_412700 [Rostrohypoxylon terebratum]